MAEEISATVTGHLTDDPELKILDSGKPVASFVIASTPRRMVDGEWVKDDSSFLRCQVWGAQARHVAASLRKGDRVLATGRLRQRTYRERLNDAVRYAKSETRAEAFEEVMTSSEAPKRTIFELNVEEIGPTLRFTTAQVQRAERESVTE